ncbi:unnamed protein product, partial [Closterium sp. NIES-54]
AYNGHEEALSALVRHGAAVDARSHGGVTPLIAAAEGRHACCIHLLVQGKTALMHAVGHNSVLATEALLARGRQRSDSGGWQNNRTTSYHLSISPFLHLSLSPPLHFSLSPPLPFSASPFLTFSTSPFLPFFPPLSRRGRT